MMLCNRFFTCQCLGLVKPNYFHSEIHQLISKTLITYFEKYRQLPSKIFIKQELENHLKERKTDTFETLRMLYLAEANTIYDYYSDGGIGDVIPCLDAPEAMLDKITVFARTQAMRMAFSKSLELLRKDPESDGVWLKIDEVIKEARLVNRQIDIGLDYFQTLEERYARMQTSLTEQDVFTTGFETLDRSLTGGGLCKGELGAWMGNSNSGKSICLTWATIKNIMRGKKVLYISTEMDQDRVATRFDAQITAIGQHELILRKEEVWNALREQIDDYEDKRRLVIKQFPSGQADLNTIRAYYSQIVMLGFKPDLFIVDYPGDMKGIKGLSIWESRFLTIQGLRGFGVEEGHCTLVAIQPNRGASELTIDEFIDESKQADSYSQNRVFDAFWTINQTREEHNAEVGRIWVAKARNGKSKFSFKIKYGFNDQTLILKEISDAYYRKLMSNTNRQAADEVVFDDIHVANEKDEDFT